MSASAAPLDAAARRKRTDKVKKNILTKLSILTRLQGVLKNKDKQKRESDSEVTVEPMETPLRWSTSFESLLSDSEGRKMFTKFLGEEYCQENMTFWTSCCQYETVDEVERKELANEIFEKHLSTEKSTEPVNVDSAALNYVKDNLCHAPQHLFSTAKLQIFMLMKTDKYRRFLSSDLSKCPAEKCRQDKVLVNNDNTTNGNVICAGKAKVSPATERKHVEVKQSLKPRDEQPLTGTESGTDATETLGPTNPERLATEPRDSLEINLSMPAKSAPTAVLAACHGVDVEQNKKSSDTTVQSCSKSTTDSRELLSMDGCDSTSHSQTYSQSEHLSKSCDGESLKMCLQNRSLDHEDVLSQTPVEKKKLYLLRRISVSLDQMIVLEEAGIHNTNLNQVSQLTEWLENRVNVDDDTDDDTDNDHIEEIIDSVKTLQTAKPR